MRGAAIKALVLEVSPGSSLIIDVWACGLLVNEVAMGVDCSSTEMAFTGVEEKGVDGRE